MLCTSSAAVLMRSQRKNANRVRKIKCLEARSHRPTGLTEYGNNTIIANEPKPPQKSVMEFRGRQDNIHRFDDHLSPDSLS